MTTGEQEWNKNHHPLGSTVALGFALLCFFGGGDGVIFYLKGRLQGETQKHTHTSSIHWFIPQIVTTARARLKLEDRNSIRVSHEEAGAKVLGPFSRHLPRYISRKQHQKQSKQDLSGCPHRTSAAVTSGTDPAMPQAMLACLVSLSYLSWYLLQTSVRLLLPSKLFQNRGSLHSDLGLKGSAGSGPRASHTPFPAAGIPPTTQLALMPNPTQLIPSAPSAGNC